MRYWGSNEMVSQKCITEEPIKCSLIEDVTTVTSGIMGLVSVSLSTTPRGSKSSSVRFVKVGQGHSQHHTDILCRFTHMITTYHNFQSYLQGTFFSQKSW